MKQKINLRPFFLFLMGMLFALPAMAEEYHKTITVLQQGQVVPVEDFYFNSLDGERKPSRVEVKNGAEFYIQLQQNHQIESLSGGTLEEKK